VLDFELIHALGLSNRDVDAVTARERLELERRERLYRGSRPSLDLKERTAILVDDGLDHACRSSVQTKPASELDCPGSARSVGPSPREIA
jgi:predicted phosphoribosyltransferase